MKKFLWGLVIAGVLFPGGFVLADNNYTSKKSADKKSSLDSSSAADLEAENRKTEDDRRKELNNSEWAIHIYEKGQDTSTAAKDKLVFKDGTMSIEGFLSKGYPKANYSLVTNPKQEGGTWESYIVGEKGALSIRGDWKKNVMNGVASEKIKGEEKQKVYYFSSQEKMSLAPKEAEPAAAGAAPASPTGGSLTALVAKENPSSEKRY